MIKQLYRFLNPRFQNLFLDYKVDFKPRYGYGKSSHKELNSIIGQNKADYASFLDKALDLKEELWSIRKSGQESDLSQPAWNNGFLPGLDIVALYTMMATIRPNKYVEVGSGNSTKVVHKAKSDLSIGTEMVSIDPMPRTEIDSLVDKVIRQPFENTNYSIVDELGENDILFIDNSHRLLPNSDSMVFFLEVLPRLKKGVIVQIHDIYLPYDYPQEMCDRAYSEQYALALCLLSNPERYQCLLPNYYISEDKELADRIAPIWEHDNLKNVEVHGGSFWLKIGE